MYKQLLMLPVMRTRQDFREAAAATAEAACRKKRSPPLHMLLMCPQAHAVTTAAQRLKVFRRSGMINRI